MVDGSIPAEQLSPVAEALHVDKESLPALELEGAGLLARASLSAPSGLLAPKDEDVLVARPQDGGAHGPKAKTTLILWLLWTLCKVKDDGVHMFSAYIGQLLSAGIVEPDAVLHTLLRHLEGRGLRLAPPPRPPVRPPAASPGLRPLRRNRRHGACTP